MSGGRITVDGLWRCLCPSFDETILSRAVSTGLPRATRRPSRPRPSICTAAPWQPQARRRFTNPAVANSEALAAHDTFNIAKASVEPPPTLEDLVHDGFTTTTETLLKDSSRAALHNAPTTVIYETLRALQERKDVRNRLRAFVKYLVVQRGQKPNSFLYEALIASNCDPAGSAKEIRDILNEMTRLGIEPTTGLYRVALKALAIHPDFILRNRIVSEMKRRWMDLGVEGRCSVTLGLLRDGQQELALGKLEEMANEGVDVPSWVYDVFMVVLIQHGAIDEAIGLLQRRIGDSSSSTAAKPNKTAQDKISLNIWYLLLDESSRRFHYEGTRLVWDQMVAPHTLVPSDGTCLNILNTASRYSDPGLATDVIQLLSSRGVKLATHHYEALVDCYANRDDVENALGALCIMADRAGLAPDNASTRSVYLAFTRVPALVRAAADALRRLRETHVVPLPALNVVIQGFCHVVGDHRAAVNMYAQVRSLCACRPEAYTYAALLDAASAAEDTQVVRFLVAEMASFGLQPGRSQLDAAARAFLARDDVDGAFDLLASVAGLGVTREAWLGRETAVVLARRLFMDKDERVWGLLETAEGLGIEMGAVTRYLQDDKRRSAEEEEVPPVGRKEVPLGDSSSWSDQDAILKWSQIEAEMKKASQAGAG